ncbi:MAG TPA: 2Fe-2S iron-sulfur cluster-binding protein [Oligoflexus sp.]|uniref:2Fe-2S iron-sulfur cluster-binding protein n=1 Tax=Oligoflexus sp. TaxID=1971216 RepID=UPI002D5438A2|nr:2Fe-2S iron-sulfur cluster-binding protein [Oligoflexus sp.]HYX35725.1 2Fe-2S iron-sulfur cluster-binding protein [Oligoflexus sp.]
MSTTESPKPKVTIDGQVIEFQPGDTIMRAAERAHIDQGIPRFCYHPGLPVAGTCRMCTVEVEKAPKLMTACSTPAADGMIVHTQSEKVRKSRAGVMEFLLTNHPLDCPVCDQAGECSLQDYNYEYGPGTSEFREEKRVYGDAQTKPLSDRLTLNMNRCIHCERCVRYTEDVTKTSELLMNSRGWRKELTTALEEGLFNEYQGNIADICPVGAITFNDFRFQKRVWFLKEKNAICDGCAKGCSIYADQEKNVIYRYRARHNEAVNGHWICDEGRVSFHTYQDPERVVQPMLKAQASLVATNWETLVPWLMQSLSNARRVLLLIGTDATSEEAATLTQILPSFTKGEVVTRFYNGTNGVRQSSDDSPLDELLRRKDKTPNTKGMELLGLHPLTEQDQGFDVAIYFRSGRAAIPAQKLGQVEIAWGVFSAREGERFAAVLPGLGTVEKFGTFTQCDGVTQSFEAIIQPHGASASVKKILDGMRMKAIVPILAAREVARDSV